MHPSHSVKNVFLKFFPYYITLQTLMSVKLKQTTAARTPTALMKQAHTPASVKQATVEMVLIAQVRCTLVT